MNPKCGIGMGITLDPGDKQVNTTGVCLVSCFHIGAVATVINIPAKNDVGLIVIAAIAVLNPEGLYCGVKGGKCFEASFGGAVDVAHHFDDFAKGFVGNAEGSRVFAGLSVG